MAGRKAKPTSIIALEGNLARKTKAELTRRANNEEVLAVVEPDKFMAPDNLQGSARDIFYETKGMLKKMGILHNADIRLVATYARTAALADDLWDEVEAYGLTMPADKTNKIYNNPNLNEWRKTTTQMVKLASELGFTPTSRASLANKMMEDKKKAENVDEFDD